MSKGLYVLPKKRSGLKTISTVMARLAGEAKAEAEAEEEAKKAAEAEEEAKKEAEKEEYTEFPDVASGGWEYDGDGRAQVDFFKANSNYDELISGMNADEREAFREWTRGHFMGGQQYKDWDTWDRKDKWYTEMYDDILDRATLDKGVVVTRRSDAQLVMGAGHKRATLEELQAMKGRSIVSKGSMSCGAAAQGLTIGDSSKKVEYKISIPGGTKGAGMWVGDDRINGWGPKQREFMTNRDVVYTVGDTTYDSKRDMFVVELTFRTRLFHDYGKYGRRKKGGRK